MHRSLVRLAVVPIILFLLQFVQSPALAQDASEPKSAATAFLNALDSSDPGAIYDKWVASRAKEAITKLSFIQNVNVFRIQAGGPVQSRLFVGGTALSQLQNGTTGDFYYIRFREGYPTAQLFFDVTLEHEGQNWLVLNYYLSPAPP